MKLVLLILLFRIKDVSLDCSVNRTTDGGRATAVEGCLCPPGYKVGLVLLFLANIFCLRQW